MKPIINKILTTEFELFQDVKNIDGRASCQDDWDTFRIMRGSQFSAWNSKMLSSYDEDLTFSAALNRNLLWEKYAYMMRFTDPRKYADLEQYLPNPDSETMNMINEIVKCQVAWIADINQEYPVLCAGGRPIYTQQDSLYQTSFETYLTGELMTYSKQTIRLYLDHVHKLLEAQENMGLICLKSIAKEYGYPSVEDAEKAMSKQGSATS